MFLRIVAICLCLAACGEMTPERSARIQAGIAAMNAVPTQQWQPTPLPAYQSTTPVWTLTTPQYPLSR